ncbi:hypothetical protein ES708_08589 [subsurface metagenome]
MFKWFWKYEKVWWLLCLAIFAAVVVFAIIQKV